MHNLKHVGYGKKRRSTELNEEELDRLEKSRIEANNRAGKFKLDDPDVLRSLLKYYQGDVQRKKFIWKEFFSQFEKTDLVCFYYFTIRCKELVDIDGVAHDKSSVLRIKSLDDEVEHNPEVHKRINTMEDSHPFIRRKQDFRSLIRSNTYAINVLDEVIHKTVTLEDLRESTWLGIMEDLRMEQKNKTIPHQTDPEDYSSGDDEVFEE